MLSLSWLVPGSILSLFSLAYAEPVHLPLIRLPRSDSAVDRSLVSVERRNSADAGLSGTPGFNVIPVSFGTPTQTLPLVLSLSLPGAMVVGCNKPCTNSSLFNYTDSSSARIKSTSTQNITDTLLRGIQVPGNVFTDVVGFGPFSILDASFFVADSYPYVGIFGLGFPSASFQNLPSVWQSLLSSNPVDAPEMGIWLPRGPNNSTLPGVFTFGGTNSSLFTGAIDFLDSTSTSAWALNITKFTVQGHVLPLTQSRNDVAFDLSTPLIIGPISSVATIWAQVPGASQLNNGGAYQYPCSTTLNVSVSFGGRTWTLEPANLNYEKITGGNDTQCLGAIIGSDAPGWTFGESFFRSVYTVLRQGNPPAVGFAERSEQAGGAPSPTLPSTASSGSVSQSTPPSSTPPSVTAKKSPVAAVVGGVVGGVILCAVFVAALLLSCRRRRQHRPDEGGVKRDLTPEPFLAVDQRPEIAPLNSAQRRFKRKLQESGASLNYPSRIDAGSGSATQPGETVGEGENGASSPPAAAAADMSVMEQLRNLIEEMRGSGERDPRGSIAPPSYHPDA